MVEALTFDRAAERKRPVSQVPAGNLQGVRGNLTGTQSLEEGEINETTCPLNLFHHYSCVARFQ